MLSLKQWEPSAHTAGDHTITFEVKRLGFLEAKAFQAHANRLRFDVLLSQGSIIEAMQREDLRARRSSLRRAVDAAEVPWPTLDEAKAGWRARHALAVEAASDEARESVAVLTVEAVADDEILMLEAASRLKAAGHEVPELSVEETTRLVAEQEPHIIAVGEKMAEFGRSLNDPWIASTFADYVRNVDGVEVDGARITTGAQLLAVADEGLVLYVIRRIKALCELSAASGKTLSLPRTSAPEARTGNGASIVPPVVSADSPSLATVTATPAAPGSSSASETPSVLVSP